MSDDCLFCKVLSGDIPSTEVYSDDEFYAFRDINPGAPTHVLIIPRQHIAMMKDITEEHDLLIGRMMRKGTEVARAEGLDDDGYRLVLNCGTHGGQSVYHIHLHIFGGRFMAWPPG